MFLLSATARDSAPVGPSWLVDKFNSVRFLFVSSATAIDLTPVEPRLLPDKLNSAKVVFVLSDAKSESAPAWQRLLPDKFNFVTVVFLLSAAARDSAPGGPRLMPDIFNSVRVLFVSRAKPRTTAAASSIRLSLRSTLWTLRLEPKDWAISVRKLLSSFLHSLMHSSATSRLSSVSFLLTSFATSLIRATRLSSELTASRPQVNCKTCRSSRKYLVSVTNISGLICLLTSWQQR